MVRPKSRFRNSQCSPQQDEKIVRYHSHPEKYRFGFRLSAGHTLHPKSYLQSLIKVLRLSPLIMPLKYFLGILFIPIPICCYCIWLYSARSAKPPCAVSSASVLSILNPNTVCRIMFSPCRLKDSIRLFSFILAFEAADKVFLLSTYNSYLCFGVRSLRNIFSVSPRAFSMSNLSLTFSLPFETKSPLISLFL